MAWTIEYSDSALKTLRKLDRSKALDILNYMERRVATADDPRVYGKALTGSLKGHWR